jgi:hypothetical protein
MLSGLHSLRSASNEMPSPCSASSGQSTKYLARFSRHRRSADVALTRCYASRPWSRVVGSFHPSVWGAGGGCCSASNQELVGASRRSAAPGSQSIGSQLLVRSSSAFHTPRFASQGRGSFLVRFHLVVCLRQRWHTSVTGVPSQHAMPNPSIERTNNGGSGFTAFSNAQPPLFASHLKR